MRILLIEDDRALCQVLQPTLEAAGFASDCCHNGADGLALLRTGYYDACILDRMLPELDGLTLLSALRQKGIQTPVILATAMDSLNDKISGLDCGADDYITKPFAPEELLARIRALARRPGNFRKEAVYSFGDLEFDPGRQELSSQGKTLSLSKKESALLEYLIKNKENPVKRPMLLSYVWGSDAEVEEGNLDNYIYFLRRRLRSLKSRVQIRTIHGVGYSLTDQTEG